ncbi:sensor histidine kinase [Teredinibacter turnerae]|uniref:sensor histidine kinase n=1 Tax=Teredinibacter turnerae TaxID=2426 RepID=UPI00035E4962|nr:histidine kinase [Teredinibacter turnerae]
MHPLLSAPRNFIVVFVFWLFICCCVAMLMVLLATNANIGQLYAHSFVLVLPWYLFFLFICFSNYYLCQLLQFNVYPLPVVIGSQLIALAVSVSLWLLLGFGWASQMDNLGLLEGNVFFQRTFNAHWLLGAILYCTWILIHYTYLHAVASEQKYAQELQQQLLIKSIDFTSVKASVHPHFMYNSLNTLANLSLVEPEKIHGLCVQMAEFLRYSVNYSSRPQVSLADEINHIQNYLAVESERFPEKIKLSIRVSEQANAAQVFPLLLFPLIENSIKHGINSSTDSGFITVGANVANGMLTVRIENSLDPSGTKADSTRVGLSTLRKRLHAHFGVNFQLNTETADRRFSVQVDIPFTIHLVTQSVESFA